MNIQLCSDLHLDCRDLFLPGGDVLLLSGDICEARDLGKNNYIRDWVPRSPSLAGLRADRVLRFFNEEVTKYRKVFYIAGNHEHYSTRFDKTHKFMRENVPANTTVLENESVEFEGVLFMGATYWTDFNNHDELTVFSAPQIMNDYKYITVHDNGSYYKMRPRNVQAEHRRSKRFFETTLELNRNGAQLPVVVMTHHAPSFLSIAPWHQGNRIKAGLYCSDQSNMMLDNPEIKVWVHGHVHEPFDYNIGDARILCNPRGYYGSEPIADNYSPLEFTL